MSRIIVLLALVLIALVQAKIKTEEKVLVLDDDNFEEVSSEKKPTADFTDASGYSPRIGGEKSTVAL
mgnify:CR=1 FL=1